MLDCHFSRVLANSRQSARPCSQELSFDFSAWLVDFVCMCLRA